MSTINQADLVALTQEQLMAMIISMSSQPARKLSMKVTDKGGLSVYGLGRFPTTLYRSQWERLLADDTVAQLKAFMVANASLLAVKA